MMVDGVFSQLDDVIATLAGVDVDTLAPSELDALVVGLQRARQRLAGVSAGVLVRWDTAGVWRSDGSRTAAGRLARDASTSLSTAHLELRRDNKMSAMPVTAEVVVA